MTKALYQDQIGRVVTFRVLVGSNRTPCLNDVKAKEFMFCEQTKFISCLHNNYVFMYVNFLLHQRKETKYNR